MGSPTAAEDTTERKLPADLNQTTLRAILPVVAYLMTVTLVLFALYLG